MKAIAGITTLQVSVMKGLHIDDSIILPVPEVMNHATITGSIDISRNPGVITITILVPVAYLEKIDLADIAKQQYL